MAELNTKFYTAKDSYSDGNIENDILNIVNGKKDISQYYGEYAVLYHLSPVRENIVNWYPFKKNSTCLEIGAGCGAITAALCQRVKKVVSVDISKRRSEINYQRNKSFDNLEIIVGNIHEIEFEEKFDYIILNGVFEYAMSFTKTTNNPYVEFLTYIGSLLNNKKGKILIAIENRLGLKYFSGAPEDHTSSYFLGLNNYVGNTSVRTFSKAELSAIIEKSGYNYFKFYYPYPDYKFPNEIFTDSTIYDFKYGKDYYNYNPQVFSIFDENKIAEALSREKVISTFANSFFVEISVNNSFSDVIYAKMNVNRNTQFRIATVITENRGKRCVEKIPLTKEAEAHIENIYNNAKKTVIDGVKNCPVKLTNGGVAYDYCSCRNMDDVILEIINREDFSAIYDIIAKFFKPFLDISQVKDYHNEKFCKIFGNEKFTSPLKCVRPANIDMICDNIMINDSDYTLIDTEWIFDIDVPVLFILWRTIRELYTRHPRLNEAITFEEMLVKFNINSEMSHTFNKWALHFVDYVGIGLGEKFSYLRKKFDLNQFFSLNYGSMETSLYVKGENGYSEKDKFFTTLNVRDDGSFVVRFQLDKPYENLRWDPLEGRCCRCCIDEINGTAIPVNAIEDGEFQVFESDDPQYIIHSCDSTITIKGRIEILDISESAEIFSKQVYECRDQIHRRNLIIDEINERNALIENENQTLQGNISDLNDRIEVLNDRIEGLKDRIEVENNTLEYLIKQINHLQLQVKNEQTKYNEIINSKGWQTLDKIRKFIVLFRR